MPEFDEAEVKHSAQRIFSEWMNRVKVYREIQAAVNEQVLTTMKMTGMDTSMALAVGRAVFRTHAAATGLTIEDIHPDVVRAFDNHLKIADAPQGGSQPDSQYSMKQWVGTGIQIPTNEIYGKALYPDWDALAKNPVIGLDVGSGVKSPIIRKMLERMGGSNGE